VSRRDLEENDPITDAKPRLSEQMRLVTDVFGHPYLLA
jgi:hypothetical protein